MNLTDARVLLVEDDEVMRTYTANTLKQLGVTHLQECVDGASALRMMVNFRPDVILTDIHMKPMDGLEFVKRLRGTSNAAVSRIKVIFMSADSSRETLVEARPLGVSAYIVKPPKAEDLKTRLQSALNEVHSD